ncbi:N-6 DNA methylase [Methylorubrum populi]|uniref:HsdM family class I SAM-dependent methyltransferase n=1 Tax=Methylorubrum rhodesianum TaxID=29427 RepID=UPI0019093B3F|nr:N-6 DNA methylase [Methylorubrum rhodesianum]MBK3404175.1 N-6 DNA methylase [Methylorubrum rhodesianum]MBY0142965.1 N-6 DNA methylase [Methylorubrum populi]
MGPQGGVIAELARLQGLARAPLFRPGEINGPGSHEILLDGNLGSFVVTDGDEIDPGDASSWAWSSNVPHHVLLGKDDVQVVRWDRPNERQRFDRALVFERPAAFYEHLRTDQASRRLSIVEHSMDLFRKVRNLVLQRGLDDALSTPAYLTLLAAFTSGHEPFGPGLLAIERAFSVPHGSADLVSLLPQAAVETLATEFAHMSLGDVSLAARPVLTLRHASGAIFQEAHHRLVDGPPVDLFGFVGPARSVATKRSVVHFTPPSLARSLCEQALPSLGDLGRRKALVIGDLACGSGAFLLEALRSLERVGYAGHITVVGRDISPTAVDMARFALGMATMEWPGSDRVTTDIAVADTLRTTGLPAIDLMVMNPPYVRWQNLAADERDLLARRLGHAKAGRPDLSMAFVLCALDALRLDGALAVLLPASVLETKAAEGWRGLISEGRSVRFDAVFDDYRMFSHARVRLGALVLGPIGAGERVEMRVGRGPEAAGDALRALRRGDVAQVAGAPGTFAISTTRLLPASAPWVRQGPSKTLTARALAAGARTVGELFRVQQGIRSGENEAFVLDDEALAALPPEERRHFRPALSSDGIEDGRITGHVNVFYPYDRSGFTIRDVEALENEVPVFLHRHLVPWHDQLRSRRSRKKRWWGLSERRRMLEEGRPFLVSKYWGKAGAFALREDAGTVILQGYGWFPVAGRPEIPPSSDIAAAYLALVNSAAFFRLVAEHAPPTGGGHLNLGTQYVIGVPMIDLTVDDVATSQAVRTLAAYARGRYLDRRGAGDVTDAMVEEVVGRLYGLGDAIQAGDSAPPPAQRMPEWVLPLVAAGLQGADKNARYDVLLRIQELAKEGAFEEIDRALSEAPVDALADTSLMTLLRGSYRFRSRVPCWDGFRDRVRDVYASRDMPVDDLMYGLYE